MCIRFILEQKVAFYICQSWDFKAHTQLYKWTRAFSKRRFAFRRPVLRITDKEL